MINDVVRDNGRNGIEAQLDSLGQLSHSFIAHNGGDGATLDETVAHVIGNKFIGNGGIGLSMFDDACFFFQEDEVSDNVAVQNAQGGMAAFLPVSPPQTCDGVRGTGNAAQN